MTDLSTSFIGIQMKNPLVTASGTCGYGHEMSELFDLSLLGGISIKGITPTPRLGNPPPRIAETACGMLNSVGLQNPGVDYVIEKELPFLAKFDTAVIANIAGHSFDDYRIMAEKLDNAAGVAALEVNISCPNVSAGGMTFGVDPKSAHKIISLVKDVTKLPVIAKLSPNVTDITEIAKACEDAGADGLSLINTLLGMVIDAEKRKPVLANRTGGLSGPAIKPVALHMVWKTAQAVKIPIMGMGGISTGLDAVEFLMAGATAFQIGSINFHDPMAAPRIIRELNEWCDAHNIKKASELIGTLE